MRSEFLIARRKATNAVFVTLCWIAAAIALGALAAILFSLFKEGIGGMNLDIFTKDTPAEGSVGGLPSPWCWR
jgi:phosphate transport system permease protein